jgi:hypothetical protein
MGMLGTLEALQEALAGQGLSFKARINIVSP